MIFLFLVVCNLVYIFIYVKQLSVLGFYPVTSLNAELGGRLCMN